MPRLHLIHVARIQVVSTCIHLYRLSPSTSCIGDKLLLRRRVSTCIRIQVARPGYLYPATSGVNAALEPAFNGFWE